MRRCGQTIGGAQNVLAALAVLGLVVLAGCHDWPNERATAIEAQNILRDLGRIETVADPNLRVPDVYKAPPEKLKQIVAGSEEWKLFYFCQYHTSDKLKTVLLDQFSSRIFDEKGKSVTVPNFGITSNPDTNQLIVRTASEADIDAVYDVLARADVPPVQVKIDCMVSELYADMTMDRQTEILIENLFGEQIRLGEQDLVAFPGAALRDPAREKFGLKIGVSRGLPGQTFEALVDILVSRGYLKILMNPRLEVVNGQPAQIESQQRVPLQQISIRGGFGSTTFIETRTEYAEIIDSLKVTPHVFADGYIGLQTDAQIAAYLTPEGIKQVPIVTERRITNKDNRIRIGESLIIGGIRKSEKRDVIRGVPILKDIPGLNLLFSGRDFEERATEVIFILTPTISTAGMPNRQAVDYLRTRHEMPYVQGLAESVMDPLGLAAREQDRQRDLDRAIEDAQRSGDHETMMRLEAVRASEDINRIEEELRKIRAETAELDAKAQQAQAEAQKATTEAQAAKTTAAEAKAEAEKATSEAAQPDEKPEGAPKEPAPPEEAPKEEPSKAG